MHQFTDSIASDIERRYGISRDEAKQAVRNMVSAAPSQVELLGNIHAKELADMAYYDYRDQASAQPLPVFTAEIGIDSRRRIAGN